LLHTRVEVRTDILPNSGSGVASVGREDDFTNILSSTARVEASDDASKKCNTPVSVNAITMRDELLHLSVQVPALRIDSARAEINSGHANEPLIAVRGPIINKAKATKVGTDGIPKELGARCDRGVQCGQSSSKSSHDANYA
jgi:hypothetical protein